MFFDWTKKFTKLTFPDSNKHKLCGLPFSTRVTRSFLNARWSTYTGAGSGSLAPRKQIAIFTRQPNVVLTLRGLRPNVWNNLINEFNNCNRGRSSATTAHVRIHDNDKPRF